MRQTKTKICDPQGNTDSRESKDEKNPDHDLDLENDEISAAYAKAVRDGFRLDLNRKTRRELEGIMTLRPKETSKSLFSYDRTALLKIIAKLRVCIEVDLDLVKI